MKAEDKDSKRRAKMNIDAFFGKLLSLISRHSPETLSYSKISRWTGVSRTTLYYYFGSSLENMLKEAAAYGAKIFTQMTIVKDHKSFPDYRSFQSHIVSFSHKTIGQYPWAPSIYLRYRDEKNFLGEAIRETEEAYFREQIAAWRHFHKSEPDLRKMRYVAYLKVGILYGLSTDASLWYGNEENENARARLSAKIAELAETLVRN